MKLMKTENVLIGHDLIDEQKTVLSLFGTDFFLGIPLVCPVPVAS